MTEWYALWDVTHANLVDEFERMEDALATVRWLSSNAGDEFSGNLSLTHESTDEADNEVTETVAELDQLLRLAWGETGPQAKIDVARSMFGRLVRLVATESPNMGIAVANTSLVLTDSDWQRPRSDDPLRQTRSFVLGIA